MAQCNNICIKWNVYGNSSTRIFSLTIASTIDDLLSAMQCMILGNFPIKLIDFTTLQNILRNVTLSLPNGYELIVGTKTENIHLYYQIAKVSMIANAHHIKLIVNIPLKTYNKDLDWLLCLNAYQMTNLFNTLLIFHILVYKMISITIFC